MPCTLLIRPGKILESVARPSLFTMNEHAIANVDLDLSFLLGIMFVYIHFYKLAFGLKRYKLMWEYLARNLKADVNILVLLKEQYHRLRMSRWSTKSGPTFSSLWSVKQNGVNKLRTILTVTEAVETTLAVRSFFNSGSGRKQEREKSRRKIWLEENICKLWLQAKLEARYSSTSNNEFAMNLLSLENRRRQNKRQKSNYKQIWFIYIINLPCSCTASVFCHIDKCLHSALYPRPLKKTTTITRSFPPGAARPFAFTAFRLTFLDGKKFGFAISNSKIP